ncbi:signal peptidase I [Alkanindiges hydrocarboniclasticus]|uniref:Signal peptidase I n=1 Tax=Alkanindiges hydrocarboniclasticus TaxID=1907941 RepID=A0A1S8CQD2_9GAMM|nr:signal peptidase I [Alkanindiges hydrocarboniclasticus]ONG37374.1 signal peptidase I [Alkanindiges hydrocarboniclasticus]
MTTKASKISNWPKRIFWFFAKPPVEFVQQLHQATRGKRLKVMWTMVFMGLGIIIAQSASQSLGMTYGIGMDVSNISSNDHIFYLIKKNEIAVAQAKVGDYLVFQSDLLKPYVNSDAVIIKKIAATAGDRIKVQQGVVTVNGKEVTRLNPIVLGKLHKKASDYDREMVLPKNAFFVLGSNPRSYDSRYWNYLVIRQETVSRAYPFLF